MFQTKKITYEDTPLLLAHVLKNSFKHKRSHTKICHYYSCMYSKMVSGAMPTGTWGTCNVHAPSSLAHELMS